MFQLHETTALIPPGASNPVQVDNEMVPLIRALWSKNLITLACCQDDGESVEAERAQRQGDEPTGHSGFIEYYRGWAWLKMPLQDALSLLASLSDHESFGRRIKVRWQRGSWRMHIPVTYQQDQFGPAPHVQIYFPKDQIAELATAVAAVEMIIT